MILKTKKQSHLGSTLEEAIEEAIEILKKEKEVVIAFRGSITNLYKVRRKIEKVFQGYNIEVIKEPQCYHFHIY